MNKEELIAKIKKLLALSGSSNPNEAAVALSRAQKLMELYKIEADDLKLPNDVDEIRVNNASAFCTGMCVHGLAHIICKAFGVDYVAHADHNSKYKTVSFIGPKDLLESCEYIYVYLSRLAIAAINRFNKILDLSIACSLIKQRDIIDFVNSYGSSTNRFIVQCWCDKFKDYEDVQKCNEDDRQFKIFLEESKIVTWQVKNMRYTFPVFYSFFLKQRRLSRRGFIKGYLNAIKSKVVEYSQNQSVVEKIEQYLENHYSNLRVTNSSRYRMGQREYEAYSQGNDEGNEVSISSALNGTAAQINELEYF